MKVIVILLLGLAVYADGTVFQWFESVPRLVKTFKRVIQSVRDTATMKDRMLFQKEFEDYKARHNRHYKTQDEEAKRYATWLANFSTDLLADPTRSWKINDEEYDLFPEEIQERVQQVMDNLEKHRKERERAKAGKIANTESS